MAHEEADKFPTREDNERDQQERMRSRQSVGLLQVTVTFFLLRTHTGGKPCQRQPEQASQDDHYFSPLHSYRPFRSNKLPCESLP